MANQKLTELDELITPSDDDLLYIVKNSDTASYKIKYSNITSQVTGGPTLVVAASNASDTLKDRADYICDGTNDNVEIQSALDTLPATGGKVVLTNGLFTIGASIIMEGYQRLEGSGKGTILKAKNSFNSDVIYTQTATFNRYVEIANLKIDGNRDNNTSGRGINLYAPRNCTIEHVWIAETDEEAIRLSGDATNLGWYNWIINNEVDGCDDGIKVNGYCEHNYIQRNTITFILFGNGVFCDSDQDVIAYNKFDRCVGNGVHVEFGSGAYLIENNTFDNGDGHDIVVRLAPKTKVHGNWFGNGNTHTGRANIANGQYGSDASNYISVQGNISTETLDTFGIKEFGGATVGCIYANNILTGPDTPILLDTSTVMVDVDNNMGTTNMQEKKIMRMKNTSGGALAVGDVVVLKAVAAGNEVTTTTTQGDDNVFGMAAETIADAAYGYILVTGNTVSLKVNGTTDIAIGDLLGTYTTAKISMKASVGDMVFAKALEAYTANDSLGVIDAILITPKLI